MEKRASKRKLAITPLPKYDKRLKSICQNCRHPINEKRETSIKCIICSEWLHLRCSSLTSADLKLPEKINAVRCTICDCADGYISENDEIIVEGTSETTADNENLKPILCQIVSHLKGLRAAVKALQIENVELKARVLELNHTNTKLTTQVGHFLKTNDRGAQPQPRGRSESRVRTPPALAARTRERSSDRKPTRTKNGGAALSIPSRPTAVNTRQKPLIKRIERRGGDAVDHPSNVDAAAVTLPSIKTRINTRRLHISKICSSVSAQSLHAHLKTHAKVHPITVKKLRSRREEGRFFIEVLDVDYDNVVQDHLWDDGIEISFYRGNLRENLVLEEYPNN